MLGHLAAVFKSDEQDENSAVWNFQTTAGDGKHYNQKYYSLQAIIAAGFEVNSNRAINEEQQNKTGATLK